ncbi:hypothetical protein QQF64_032585 [Cirrhinus molitorella]|uniref:Uncharacterized protein n=1 Tax=Cirrhinus molitorella TaxID=172907 RepID=A0ABR3N085_9TELE
MGKVRLLSGLWSVLLFPEHRNFPVKQRDAQRNTWIKHRQTDGRTETLKLKVISHGNLTEAGSGAVTP